MSGPDLLQKLVGIIFQFRENEIPMAFDIEDMFLQVKLHLADCQFLGLLWRKKFKIVVEIYQHKRHIFGMKVPLLVPIMHLSKQESITNLLIH